MTAQSTTSWPLPCRICCPRPPTRPTRRPDRPSAAHRDPALLHNVRCGCWLISYRPIGAPLVAFDGTLRVECHSAGRTASGDLYQRPVIYIPIPIPVPIPRPRLPAPVRSQMHRGVRSC